MNLVEGWRMIGIYVLREHIDREGGGERERGKIYTLQGEKTWDRARE